jgi:hypothetical protein
MRRVSIPLLGACLVLFLLLPLGLPPRLSVQAQATRICAWEQQHVATPLTDLGNRVYVRMDGQNTGFTGGLYPDGSNLRPPAHEAAGVSLAAQIVPLNAGGARDPHGKIVMLGIGMSNAAQEFNAFLERARSDPGVDPSLTIVNGAQPGMTAEDWVDPAAPTWSVVSQRLAAQGLTPEQVQVAWVKNTLTGSGPFPGRTRVLQDDFKAIVRDLKALYPNIKLAYLSSRTNSYTYWDGLSPEPAAYETGFAVKWLIEDQINGDPELNYDPARGPVVAPFLSWGPYLWADGPNPRSDGLVWLPNDMVWDCTHPSASGEAKVAQMLLDFFKSDTTTGWFRGERVVEFRFYFPLIFPYLPPLFH